MSAFIGNTAVKGIGRLDSQDMHSISTQGNSNLIADDLPMLIERSLSMIGLQDVQKVDTVDINELGFTRLHRFTFDGHSPLRSALFLPQSGYEIFTPKQGMVSRLFNFFGDPDYIYLLEHSGIEAEGDVQYQGTFFLGYKDQILAYRKKGLYK